MPTPRQLPEGRFYEFMAIGSATGGIILGLRGFAVLNAVGAALGLGPLALALVRRPALASLASGDG